VRPLTQKWEADSSCVSCMIDVCTAHRHPSRLFAPCFALNSRASAVSRVPHLFPLIFSLNEMRLRSHTHTLDRPHCLSRPRYSTWDLVQVLLTPQVTDRM